MTAGGRAGGRGPAQEPSVAQIYEEALFPGERGLGPVQGGGCYTRGARAAELQAESMEARRGHQILNGMRRWYSGWLGMLGVSVDVMVDHQVVTGPSLPCCPHQPGARRTGCDSEERVPPKLPRSFPGEVPEGVEG